MKYKLLILIIVAICITFIIYKKNYIYNINITSINSLAKENNYNELLSEKLLEKLPNINFNVDFSSEDLEIENLIALIEHNTNNIQNIIHNSKVLIISIGNNDIKGEKIKTILNEYKKLFQLLRKYNNYEIIFISPYNFKYQEELKDITKTYHLIYINSNSYYNKNNLLVNNILKKITYIKK